MGKRKKGETAEQLPLIDVTPANQKKLIPILKEYREAVSQRCQWGVDEVSCKRKIIEMVKEMGIVADSDGSYKFRVDGATVKVTPQDIKLDVKFDADDASD